MDHRDARRVKWNEVDRMKYRTSDEIPVAEETMRLLCTSVIAGVVCHQSSHIRTLILACSSNCSPLLYYRAIPY